MRDSWSIMTSITSHDSGSSPDNDSTNDSRTSFWQVPTVRPEGRILSGVSGAIAAEVGVDVLWVRITWVALFAAGGWGGLLYVIVWGALSWTGYNGYSAPFPPIAKGRTERSRSLGFGMVAVGLVGIFASMAGLPQSLLWPSGVMALGILLWWRRLGPGAVNRSGGRFPLAQAVGGPVIAAFGASLLVFLAFGLNSAAAILYLVIFIVVAGVLATSPWWWRFVQNLDRERQAKVLADERAIVAAHLHDSVLQTLSLIQHNADDPQVMLNLARRQERELRNWLDPDRASRLGGSVRGHLDTMATEIEELYGTPVEAVVVGDCIVDEHLEQALAATREAVVNAAKHSQSAQIDIYVEVSFEQVEIFVRDRGIGFEIGSVDNDRRGISESIEARMTRIGGSSTVVSTPGEGTEVELTVPRTVDPSHSVAATYDVAPPPGAGQQSPDIQKGSHP